MQVNKLAMIKVALDVAEVVVAGISQSQNVIRKTTENLSEYRRERRDSRRN